MQFWRLARARREGLGFLSSGHGSQGDHGAGVLLGQRLRGTRGLVAHVDIIVGDGRRGREVRRHGDGGRIRRLRRVAWREEVVEAIEGAEEGEGGCRCHDPFCCGVFEVLQNDMDSDAGSLPAEAVDEVCRHSGEG